MTENKKRNPFTQGLLTKAKELCKGMPVMMIEIDEASTLVLTHILLSSMEKAGHISAVSDIDVDKASMGSTFLCFVSAYLVQGLKEEGYKVSHQEILVDSCRACFQKYSTGEIIKIIQSGIEQYQAMLASGWGYDIDGYNEEMSDLVKVYVESGDEERLTSFFDLYETLFEIREIIEEN